MKKKVMSVMLTAVMVAGLMACGSAKEETAKTEAVAAEAVESEAAKEETAATEGEGGSAAGGKLVMATNAEFPPYEYHEGDAIVGIDAEIAAAIADKLGYTLEIEDIAFDSVIPEVTSGKADMGMAGMTVTEDRKKSVNFSDTYAVAKQAIIVPEGSDIKSADDLADKKIGVQTGTTGDLYATDDFGDEAMDRYNKGMEAVQSLSQGKVDAVIIDNEPAKVFVEEVPGLQILDTPYTEEEYAIAISKDNEELLKNINDALAALKAEGKLDEIVAKYIKSE